jgi:hypothetical protein
MATVILLRVILHIVNLLSAILLSVNQLIVCLLSVIIQIVVLQGVAQRKVLAPLIQFSLLNNSTFEFIFCN